jgi:hypothetical protein
VLGEALSKYGVALGSATQKGSLAYNLLQLSKQSTSNASSIAGILHKVGPPEALFGPDGDNISYQDINQGQTGDCYFLSSLGELAKNDPNFVRNMITYNGDGTYTVTLYQQNNDLGNFFGLTKNTDNKASEIFGNSYHPVKVTVSPKDFSPNGVNWGQNAVIWPQVIETAYAKLIGNGNVTKGYSIINGGGGAIEAMGNLTGHQGSSLAPARVEPPSGFGRFSTTVPNFAQQESQQLQQDFQQLKSEVAQRDLVTLDTPDNNSLPYNLVGDHVYMVIGTYTDSHGNEYVKLQNPWGYDQPSLVPLSAWNTVFDGKDVGTV